MQEVGPSVRICLALVCCFAILAFFGFSTELHQQPSFALAPPQEVVRAYEGSVPVASGESDSSFVSNAKPATFAWGPHSRTIHDAAEATFPAGTGWQAIKFREGRNEIHDLKDVVTWVETELLGGTDPFVAFGGRVPVPHTASNAQGGKFSTARDQLQHGQWVGYSRRQVCYLVAKSLMGAETIGYQNGLVRFMHKSVYGKCTAAAGDFGQAWWTLLAACAADPGLVDGAQGPLLLAIKADKHPSMVTVRTAARDASMDGAGLRVCSYDGDGKTPGLSEVPVEGCQRPTATAPGVDFMTGGLVGQAMQDISANFLGGYVYGNACGLGGGQDERLMVYYPEVSALTFFLSEAGPDGEYGPPQLRQPAWILGARKVRTGIDGTCQFEHLFKVDPNTPMISDLVSISLMGRNFHISRSTPFIAFMSENQGYLGWPEEETELKLARRNKEPRQRSVDAHSSYSFEKQVRAWYRAVALTSYDEDVRQVLKSVVTSVGSGPWGAGLWWGDSQVSFLASWIGHAIAAQTWGGALNFDYYIYSVFTENPGNQCLVHSRKACESCLRQCSTKAKDMAHAFWLPGAAFRQIGNADPCATTGADCGAHGISEIAQVWAKRTAGELWKTVENTLRDSQAATVSVFDLMIANSAVPVAA